jgi:hypothetical protein
MNSFAEPQLLYIQYDEQNATRSGGKLMQAIQVVSIRSITGPRGRCFDHCAFSSFVETDDKLPRLAAVDHALDVLTKTVFAEPW